MIWAKKNLKFSKNFLSVRPGWPHYDSKNEKKNFEPKKFFWVQKMPKNAIFEAKCLKNGKRFWCAVFCRCSGTMWTTFWPNLIKFLRVVSEKKPKNLSKNHVFAIFRKLEIFPKNRASSLFSKFWPGTSCQVSGKSLEPFSGKVAYPPNTNYQLPTIPSLTSTDVENNNNIYGGDLIAPFP